MGYGSLLHWVARGGASCTGFSQAVHALRSIARLARQFEFTFSWLRSWLLRRGRRVLGAYVRSKFLVALAFVVLLHLVQRRAPWRTQWIECPRAIRTTPELILRGSEPGHLPHFFPLEGAFSGWSGDSGLPCHTAVVTNSGDFSCIISSATACSRTVSTTSIGTCSKCVSLFRIAASPLAASTVAVRKPYGENRLYFFELTWLSVRGSRRDVNGGGSVFLRWHQLKRTISSPQVYVCDFMCAGLRVDIFCCTSHYAYDINTYR
jgi:hypothetical protein